VRQLRLFGCLLLVGLLTAAVSAAASMPMGGTVHFFVTPSLSGNGGTIILAGAIGDYGTTSPKNSKSIGRAILKKGSFEVDLAKITKAVNNAAPTVANKTTCSYVFGATAPITIMDGTGAYKGISGVGTITETFAAIGPLYKSGAKKGECNTSNNANPVAQWASITGQATVKFG
jgi:hypothetical protein